MQTIVKWLNNRVVLVILLVLGSVLDLVLLGQGYDLNKSDWAAWVGAVGTVGALIGAIWIATGERRERDRSELTLARLHGATLKLRVHAAWVAAVDVKHEITMQSPAACSAERLVACVQMLADVNLWTIADVVPLIPLPGATAIKLADAAEYLRHIQETLLRAANRPDDARRYDLAESVQRMLDVSAKGLGEAMHVLEVGAFALYRQPS